MALEKETQSLGAAADALSQDIIEHAGSHLNQVKESEWGEFKEDIVVLEVLAFEYFLTAYAAFTAELERQDELISMIAAKLWTYVSTQQSRLGKRLTFQEFLDHRLISYMARMKEEDPLVRVADALIENIFPQCPQPGNLLAYFAIIAGSTLIANKRFFDRIAEKIELV